MPFLDLLYPLCLHIYYKYFHCSCFRLLFSQWTFLKMFPILFPCLSSRRQNISLPSTLASCAEPILHWIKSFSYGLAILPSPQGVRASFLIFRFHFSQLRGRTFVCPFTILNAKILYKTYGIFNCKMIAKCLYFD